MRPDQMIISMQHDKLVDRGDATKNERENTFHYPISSSLALLQFAGLHLQRFPVGYLPPSTRLWVCKH